MVLDDPARRALYAQLVEVLGDEHASTLMQALPSVPAANLSTKADVEAVGDRLVRDLGARMDRLEERMDRLESRFEARLEKFDDRLHGFHGELRAQVRTYLLAQAGSLVTLGALAFAAARLI